MSAGLRVIQWATGSVGREALRAILGHPALELAGVLVHSAEKSGKDAGALCDAPATGVLATDDPDAILATEADCVVYAPRIADLDEVCALLRSGKNVVSTPFLFHRRPQTEAETRKIEEACRAGSSSVHGTGIQLCAAAPGWRSSLELGLVHAGIGFGHTLSTERG